jgi:glucuronate isomerase
MEQLGIPRKDGKPVETDPRRIWQLFADNFYLFRGTPTGMWLVHELYDVFNITSKLTSETAQDIYTQIEQQLNDPDFTPRNLYQRFNVEVLCTTDAATDPLTHHQAIVQSGWDRQNIAHLPSRCGNQYRLW